MVHSFVELYKAQKYIIRIYFPKKNLTFINIVINNLEAKTFYIFPLNHFNFLAWKLLHFFARNLGLRLRNSNILLERFRLLEEELKKFACTRNCTYLCKTKWCIMLTTTISDFRKSLKGYVDSVIENNDQVLINRGRQGAVLVSLDEYNALARTASVLTSRVGADVINAAQKQEFIEVDIDSL